jgi:hypothetical protein
MLRPHNTLEEAIFARHVIRMQSYRVSNQYWEWCSIHARPFNAITINVPRSRYAAVELDLYGLGAGGFDRESGHEILRIILGQPLKPGSSFLISPVYVTAYVEAKSARLLAEYLYRSAREALSLDQITHEEWIKGDIERTRAGGPRKSAFAPVSGIALPLVIKALLDDDALILKRDFIGR